MTPNHYVMDEATRTVFYNTRRHITRPYTPNYPLQQVLNVLEFQVNQPYVLLNHSITQFRLPLHLRPFQPRPLLPNRPQPPAMFLESDNFSRGQPPNPFSSTPKPTASFGSTATAAHRFLRLHRHCCPPPEPLRRL
ncbi:hypothetical protein C1H46_005571 [Malus baccata]|uniref:Uncharacterized protein n=1 Tax=Malus baccata TaxID=106549 RepID=A0A540NE23_MALBA|nr:hypothetical protein C1H46_005571 [Malus baccata]